MVPLLFINLFLLSLALYLGFTGGFQGMKLYIEREREMRFKILQTRKDIELNKLYDSLGYTNKNHKSSFNRNHITPLVV